MLQAVNAQDLIISLLQAIAHLIKQLPQNKTNIAELVDYDILVQ